MVLADCQVQIRDLVMGPGTEYEILTGFNPFNRQVRADQSGSRAWGHGGWSGVEWMEQATVPLRIHVNTQSESAWLAAHQKLAAAFRPVGETTSPVELRFHLGGSEYRMFGRPRMVEPELNLIASGRAITQAAFVALDPFIYAAAETVHSGIGLPQFSGGLTVPLTVPFGVSATLSEGFVDINNEGTADTPMVWRIDGPASEPRVVVQYEDGSTAQLRFPFQVPAGQYVLVDTKDRTVLLNGQTNRRGFVVGEFPLLPQGTHRIRWFANEYDPAAELTVTLTERFW